MRRYIFDYGRRDFWESERALHHCQTLFVFEREDFVNCDISFFIFCASSNITLAMCHAPKLEFF
jgi:hypothetical protein